MSTDLVTVAEQRCGFSLNDAEQTVLRDLQDGHPTSFSQEQDIRAPFLRWLLTSEAAKPLTVEWGLRLDGVVVLDDLDLRAASIVCDVRFRRMRFTGNVLLYLARTRSIVIQACTLKVVDMRSAHVDGTVVIGEFQKNGSRMDAFSVRDAQISGNLDIRYSHFASLTDADAPDTSLDLVRAGVDGSVFVAPGNTVMRGIDAQDIRVKGNVNVVDIHAQREGSPGPTINFQGARIDGSLLLCRPGGARAPAPAKDDNRPFEYGYTTVEGVVSIQHARIGGNLNLAGLSVRRATAPDASPEGVQAPWWGLDLLDTDVTGSVWLEGAAVWDCGVRLSHLRVGGNVECIDLTLMRNARNEVTPAVGPAEEPSTTETADGTRPGERVAFDMAFARVGILFLWTVVMPDDEAVNLTGSKVATFEYSSGYWPTRAHLEGFSFDRLIARSYALRRRRISKLAKKWFDWKPNIFPAGRIKRWIHRKVFAPDRTHLSWARSSSNVGWEFDEALYERLAETLARQGQADDARRVLIARTNDANRARGWSSVLLGLPYRIFAGNGYRPQRAIIWTLGLIALGAVIFGRAYAAGTLMDVGGGGVPQPFQAVVYSADTLLPIVDFHQEGSFEAAGPGSEFVRVYLWIQIMLGWIIATTLGAAAASFVRRVGGG